MPNSKILVTLLVAASAVSATESKEKGRSIAKACHATLHSTSLLARGQCSLAYLRSRTSKDSTVWGSPNRMALGHLRGLDNQGDLFQASMKTDTFRIISTYRHYC